MKLAKQFVILVSAMSTVVITNVDMPAAQAEDGPPYTTSDPTYIPDPNDDPNYFEDPQNIVVNSSFEVDPLVNPKNYTLANPYITRWNNGSGVLIPGLDTIYLFQESNYPHTGFRSLSLGGTGYLSQTLNTNVGQEYQLTYYLASIDETVPGSSGLNNIFKQL
ncbi:hypothetical protein WKK05_30375 [Nostoc sp. UHCC 0302]|uniref:hypothetical protein n=1 Tax=Nostoc sp. UHCC 0302 TaxID=3134896 RepID=UPI00311CB625